MSEPDYAELAATYKAKGGAHGAVWISDKVLLNPWWPSAEEADDYWRKNINTLPVEQRPAFLAELAKLGW